MKVTNVRLWLGFGVRVHGPSDLAANFEGDSGEEDALAKSKVSQLRQEQLYMYLERDRSRGVKSGQISAMRGRVAGGRSTVTPRDSAHH